MKNNYNKILLLAAIGVHSFASYSQITLTTNDIIGTGYTMYYGVATNPGGTITIGGTGSQTWNFSSLTAASEDTLVSLLPSATPYAASFTGTNLCLQLGTSDNYYYYHNNTDSLISTGDALNDYLNGAVMRTFTPPLELFQFPATYGYAKNYTTLRYGRFAYPGAVIDSLEEKKIKTVALSIDAYGSMVTSLGTYQVLRVKETVFSNDTIFKHDPWNGWQHMNDAMDTLITYSWWAGGVGQPIAVAQCNYAGTIQWVKWLKATPSLTGINSYSKQQKDVDVFPSQDNNALQIFSAAPIEQINIFNVEGKLCERVIITEKTTTHKEINISHLTQGIYFVSVTNENSMIHNSKIMIVR